jgi:arginyl-tRNA synthetase
VEFVSANPTGPLTVGHGRNAVLGDTIARLYEWSGASVDREYYFNNAGRQMRVLGQSVQARYHEVQQSNKVPFPEGGYEGEYIKDIAQAMYDELGASLLGTEDHTPFKERAEAEIFADIKQTLKRMSIEMDSFYNEHSLYSSKAIDKVVEQLREKGLVYQKDDATWLKTTEFGKDKDTVLIKRTGEPTYRLPDIAYHITKLERGYDLAVDIFGADHIDTYPDVKNAVKALGFDESRIDVLVYQFVTIVKEGKPFKMSTRKANFITLDELMDEVGADVTRFFFLMRSPNTHLEFDIAEAKEASDKNPVFYLQYAHARIQSMLRKATEEGYGQEEKAKLDVLSHPSEENLIKSLTRLPHFVQQAATHKEPHRLIGYLNDIAALFTTFYHDCRILGVDPSLAHARMELAKATAFVLKNGLGILGIHAPEKM